MFNKFEIIGGGLSVALMALAIYLTQVESTLFQNGPVGQSAQVITATEPAVVINSDRSKQSQYLQAVNRAGNFERMVIDDVKIGTGDGVLNGDTVEVHYIGTLQNGEEFDNSRKRGETLEFEVGAGSVIKGWDEGVVGMKVGGQRVLVIPPELAYGQEGNGPIPPNSTLVFVIELVSIK